MTRRGRRGTHGAQDEGSWLPGHDEDQDYQEYLAGSSRGRRARQQPEPPGPPWETDGWEADAGGWDADSGSWPATSGQPDPGWRGHPSGPLPTSQSGGQHSGPLPPLPSPGWQDDWQRDQPGSGYPDADDEGPAGRYAGDPGGGAFAPPGAYQGGDYPPGSSGAGGDPSGSFPAGDYAQEYGTGGYPPGDYADGYPAGPDYAGSGFGESEEYAEQGFPPGTAEDRNGYSPQGRGAYADDDGEPGYPGRDPENHAAYPGGRGWYADVDEQQAWAGEGDADSGFLPGLPGREPAGRRPVKARPGGGRPGRARPAGRPGQRKRGGLRRIMPRVFLAVLLAVVLAVGGAGYYLWRTYFHPPDYSGPGTGSVVVHITSGESATLIGQQLQQLGVVASGRAFGNAAKASPQGNALEPGYYRLHKHMQASLAFAMLLKPSSRVQLKVLIPEGWRLSRIVATLGQKTGNVAGYQRAVKDVAALGLPSYANGNPEGFLFPDTYQVQPGSPPTQVLREMVQRFSQVAASLNLPAVARHDQLSEHDVVVVASLIQAEGGRLQDFPKIARVIYNRLNSGMKLQLDSTVMYALHKYGIMASTQDLTVNSPYNTYLHTNLPPGPIDSPGKAAILAALHPAAGNWLYFVTVDPKTGVTKFTSDPAVFAQLRAQLQQNVANGK